jgi:hypothetical protein
MMGCRNSGGRQAMPPALHPKLQSGASGTESSFDVTSRSWPSAECDD